MDVTLWKQPAGQRYVQTQVGGSYQMCGLRNNHLIAYVGRISDKDAA